jgi:hypothetical protein
MVGDSNYPHLIRTSDILKNGTLAPEGWPDRNGYLPDGNNGPLWNIDILDQIINVKGSHGEWQVTTSDPTDFFAVTAKRNSDAGIISQDAIIKLPTSHIYPTKQGFVETTGSTTSFVFPELYDIIESGLTNARGMSTGLVSYFTYTSGSYGNRTAKVDLLNNKARFMNMNNLLFDQLYCDVVNQRLYGIYNGELVLIDTGYSNPVDLDDKLNLYLKSKTYRQETSVSWQWIMIIHDTNDMWYILDIYVDGKKVFTEPFKSTGKTRRYFRFGPVSGYDFHFEISGTYNMPGTLYFPMKIAYGGGETT